MGVYSLSAEQNVCELNTLISLLTRTIKRDRTMLFAYGLLTFRQSIIDPLVYGWRQYIFKAVTYLAKQSRTVFFYSTINESA